MIKYNSNRYLFLSILFSLLLFSSFSFAVTLENYEDEDLFADDIKKQEILKKKLNTCSTKRTNLRLLVLKDIPPWSWSVKKQKKRTGKTYEEFYGIDFKVAEELLKRSGVKFFKVHTEDNPETLEEYLVEQNKMDLAFGVNPSHDEDIKERILYPSYFGNPIVPVFAKGKEREVNSIKDLAGLKGLALKNENIGDYLFGLPKDTSVKNITSSRVAFTKLLEEEIDFLLIGYYTAQAESKRFKVEDKIVILPKVITEARRFVFMTDKKEKKHDCTPMKDVFEKYLREIAEDKKLMQDILREVYKEYEEQYKDEAPLKYLLPSSQLKAPGKETDLVPEQGSKPDNLDKGDKTDKEARSQS